MIVEVEIYPREGTETLARLTRARTEYVEIYPREGTETYSADCRNMRLNVEIYPREGTETSYQRLTACLLALKFIPVRGRKL